MPRGSTKGRTVILRKTSALFALVLAMLVFGTPAGAITGNFQADNTHTYVGLIAFYDKNDEFTHRCTGSLITATVVLTAGHCTDATTGATHARLWFQQDAGADFDPVTGTPAKSGYPVTSDVTSSHLYNYGYFAGIPNTKDAGLIVLDEPITADGPGVAREELRLARERSARWTSSRTAAASRTSRSRRRATA